MKILSLHLSNFRVHADTRVDLEDGVTGIIGGNESGKSSLLEGLVWAIFGADATRGRKNGLRWWGAPARRTASVTLRFELGGRTYRIERGESTAKLVDEEDGRTLAEGTTPVNEKAPKLIGMTFEEFSSSYMVLQKDVAKIATMGPTDRQTFVRSVMGVGRLDTGLAACRKRKNEQEKELEGLSAGLGEREPLEGALTAADQALADALASVDERLHDHAVAEDALQAAQAALVDSTDRKALHDHHTTALAQAKNALEASTLEIERLEAKVAGQAAAHSRIQSAAPDLARLEDLWAERDQLKEARATAAQLATLTSQVANLTAEISGPNGLEERIADAQHLVDVFDADALEEANVRAAGLDERLEGIRTRRQELVAKNKAAAAAHEKEAERHARRIAAIVEAGEDGCCPTCTRKLEAQYAVVLEALQEEERRERDHAFDARIDAEEATAPTDEEIETEIARDAAEKEVERLVQMRRDRDLGAKQVAEGREQLAKKRSELQAAERQRDQLQAVPFDADRLAEVEAELARIEELDRSLAGDRALLAQADETAELLTGRAAMRGKAEQELAEAEAGIRAASFDAQRHPIMAKATERARTTHEDARVALARAEGMANAAKERTEDAARALVAYDAKAERLQELREEYRLHVATDKRLTEFRAAIITTIRPEMEELMSGFVHVLTDGRHESVTLTEDFAAVLHESGMMAEVISGGCEDVAALAMRLSISQMIAERAGHPLSLLILDEPFGSLDETRRGSVMNLIRRLRSTFRQVLVISHVAETRDMVDHAVELEFDEAVGRTRVVGRPALVEVA